MVDNLEKDSSRAVAALFGEPPSGVVQLGQYLHIKRHGASAHLIIRSDFPGEESSLFLPTVDIPVLLSFFSKMLRSLEGEKTKKV